ncbi:TPA: hypothetical protein I9786_004655 [Serratia marcescens]|nr:hypothetical protein [Serratia marcescens]HAT5031853.1 hypothetical protein [Serratia marcescens]
MNTLMRMIKKEINIDPITVALLNDMLLSDKNKFCVLKVKNLVMEVESIFDFHLRKEIVYKLPIKEPRYLLFRSQKIHSVNYLSHRLILGYWCPKLAILNDKIEYTSARVALLKSLPRGSHIYFIRDSGELMKMVR